MHLPTLSRRRVPKAGPALTEHNDDAGTEEIAKPFRLLDLPKEIRLMVYEELSHITTKRHVFSLQDPEHYVTLINSCIEGVGILATCRFLNKEASYIFAPQMQKILKEAPRISVKVNHLIGLIQLRDGFSWGMNILDEILSCVGSKWVKHQIHAYRKGRRSVKSLQDAFHLSKVSNTDNNDAVKGFATFILRCAKYAEIKRSPTTSYK